MPISTKQPTASQNEQVPDYGIFQTNPGKKKTGYRGCRGGTNQKRKTELKKTTKNSPSTVKIFNLSKYVLSPAENRLLQKGLSFCPPNPVNSFELFLDMQKFRRNLTIKRHFELETITKTGGSTNETDEEMPYIHQDVRPKSNFFPLHNQGHFIPTFFDLVSTELKQIPTKKFPDKNHILTRTEKTLLKKLSDNNDLIIRPADKGGGIVIQEFTDYEMEAQRILNDNEYYTETHSNPFPDLNKRITDLIVSAHENKYINKKEKNFLLPKAPCNPYFYHLPKVHKNEKKNPRQTNSI